ncbi:MAG TPA: MBL fold metallo-hydrolase [Syntrophales bacterium]|nr:MBL fold metallo-hydrolase [Syntrophales bacterium]HOM06586.1 MBL fold metallo-hydrolase [Syntrophales bacterium]HON99631.1 MBL fold metallo-hydrolase [Syntrophales bacterium]HPC00698.1 MBL fold metallo-hydrolase [Syntrophales bacterium]HPQ06152.1 MBL fold metallo-hydrolase [Syntrophales bacterium]
MIIRCWGARGSIPVSGDEYLKYGGDTTCVEVRTKDDDIIIIDAGSGIRRLGNALLKEGRRDFTMFFTHGHWDHLIGFPFFKPIYLSSVNINMYGCSYAQATVKEMISNVMAPPHFPVAYEEIHCNIDYHQACSEDFTLKSLKVSSIPLSHPNQGVGYRFEEDGKSFVFLTDNELSYIHPGGMDFAAYRDFARGADLLIHDTEFTDEDYKKTWGHSTFTDALRLSLEAGVKTLGLFHHNQERTDQGVEEILQRCREIASQRGSSLQCVGVSNSFSFEL